MSIVNSIESVREWLTENVCPLVKLKLPDDNANDASCLLYTSPSPRD